MSRQWRGLSCAAARARNFLRCLTRPGRYVIMLTNPDNLRLRQESSEQLAPRKQKAVPRRPRLTGTAFLMPPPSEGLVAERPRRLLTFYDRGGYNGCHGSVAQR